MIIKKMLPTSSLLKGASRKLSSEEEELMTHLADWKWRVRNLYFIKNKLGKKVLFKPNWAQEILMENLWFFSIILKARQLGITTFFCILYLDQVLFNSNKTAGIIAHKQDDAKKFFNDKVKFAWDNLPLALKETLGPPNTDSVGELSFPNGSKIFVSTSVRGGSLQFLHISEFGKICVAYPKKAQEIVTGSINAVEQGCFVTIESTAEGREGQFFDYCQQAEKDQKEGRELSALDFKFFFFPWWKNPEYALENSEAVISAENEEYFKKLRDTHGIVLSVGQKKWYANKKRINMEAMMQEYPATPEEAFAVSIEGAYFTPQLGRMYEDKRIRAVPYDSSLPVETWWDLGMNDENVIIFTQSFGNEIRIIDLYTNHGEGLAHYINILQNKGYVYGRHIFPHDINVRSLNDGMSRRKTLMDLGMMNIYTVERTKDINDDIEGVRKLFSRFYVDEAKCQALIGAMGAYRKEWDDKLGKWKDRPRHDKNSHVVDPLRLMVYAWSGQEINKDTHKQDRYQDFF